MRFELERSAFWDPVISLLTAACFILGGVEIGLQIFVLR